MEKKIELLEKQNAALTLVIRELYFNQLRLMRLESPSEKEAVLRTQLAMLEYEMFLNANRSLSKL